jgi:hypothetical protein
MHPDLPGRRDGQAGKGNRTRLPGKFQIFSFAGRGRNHQILICSTFIRFSRKIVAGFILCNK